MDLETSKELETAAALSLYSYDNSPSRISEFKTRVFGGKANEVVADIYEFGDLTWVAFRGTDDLSDIMYNLRFCELDLSEWPGAKVHMGFWEMFKCIQRNVLKGIGSPNKLALTGHSMGGALALVAAPFFAAPGRTVSCYGIASPRVGNIKFCEFHESLVAKTVVLLNSYDPVPHHPFWSTFPGTAYWMTHSGIADVYMDDFDAWSKLYNVVTCTNVGDHKISKYIEKMMHSKNKEKQKKI